MSIYRESEPRCPTCASALRDHQQRLVCDRCQAMLITDADLVKAVDELGGGGVQLMVSEVLDDERPCPRCGGPASTCRVSIGPTVLADRYLRCATHGVWLPQSAMADVFARASRRAHLGGGGARTYGGVATLPSMPGGGMTGAMRSIAGAFGAGEPATSNLGINSGVGISHVHTVFVSAYKNRALACPTCASSALEFQGDRWACATCGGAFVETAALAGMVEDITGEPFELREPKGAAGTHACPVCTAPMVADELEARAIERCPEHGVWFGAHVLAAVLEHAASPEPHHGWLYRLLHRKE